MRHPDSLTTASGALRNRPSLEWLWRVLTKTAAAPAAVPARRLACAATQPLRQERLHTPGQNDHLQPTRLATVASASAASTSVSSVGAISSARVACARSSSASKLRGGRAMTRELLWTQALLVCAGRTWFSIYTAFFYKNNDFCLRADFVKAAPRNLFASFASTSNICKLYTDAFDFCSGDHTICAKALRLMISPAGRHVPSIELFGRSETTRNANGNTRKTRV